LLLLLLLVVVVLVLVVVAAVVVVVVVLVAPQSSPARFSADVHNPNHCRSTQQYRRWNSGIR
jgi:hypothetical protein